MIVKPVLNIKHLPCYKQYKMLHMLLYFILGVLAQVVLDSPHRHIGKAWVREIKLMIGGYSAFIFITGSLNEAFLFAHFIKRSSKNQDYASFSYIFPDYLSFAYSLAFVFPPLSLCFMSLSHYLFFLFVVIGIKCTLLLSYISNSFKIFLFWDSLPSCPG